MHKLQTGWGSLKAEPLPMATQGQSATDRGTKRPGDSGLQRGQVEQAGQDGWQRSVRLFPLQPGPSESQGDYICRCAPGAGSPAGKKGVQNHSIQLCWRVPGRAPRSPHSNSRPRNPGQGSGVEQQTCSPKKLSPWQKALWGHLQLLPLKFKESSFQRKAG